MLREGNPFAVNGFPHHVVAGCRRSRRRLEPTYRPALQKRQAVVFNLGLDFAAKAPGEENVRKGHPDFPRFSIHIYGKGVEPLLKLRVRVHLLQVAA